MTIKRIKEIEDKQREDAAEREARDEYWEVNADWGKCDVCWTSGVKTAHTGRPAGHEFQMSCRYCMESVCGYCKEDGHTINYCREYYQRYGEWADIVESGKRARYGSYTTGGSGSSSGR